MGGTRLIDRVRGAQSRFRNESGAGSVAFRADTKEFERIKKELQDEVIESLDFEQVGQTPREELADRLRVTLTERVETRCSGIPRSPTS
jgi:hypothetical protein